MARWDWNSEDEELRAQVRELRDNLDRTNEFVKVTFYATEIWDEVNKSICAPNSKLLAKISKESLDNAPI